MSEPLDHAQAAVRAALAAGASDAEAGFSEVRRFHAEARAESVTKLERSTSRQLAVRVFAGTRRAAFSTTDFSPEALGMLAARAVAAARSVGEDPFAGLPDAPAAIATGDLGIYDAGVAARADADKLDDVLAMERDVRAYDPRIDNSQGSNVYDATATTALANSRGFAGQFKSSSVTRSTSPVAQDGAAKRTASYGTARRGYAGLESAGDVARKAGERVIARCGARKPPTMRVPIILERDVAGAFLSELFAATSAANVATGNSYLAGRLGERIGSAQVTIVDDGTLFAGMGSAPFDAEGVPMQATVVFDRGVLSSFLYDTYYARKLGAASTGNAAGGSIGPTNFTLAPGTGSLDDLIAATPRGILILDTIGFATEYVTGTYSRGAAGLYIEGGEVAYPVEEFTIAGNVRDMLAAVDAVAGDLVLDGPVSSPSFRIAEMTVSGVQA